ncbi:MAG: hypothetical protein CMH55_02865 [Myxococcales bacterium]|nr:hypothetical protein [Myxococcales bacterium]
MAFLARVFQIREGEGFRSVLMFIYMMNAVGAFITGRIVRDSLFLSKSDLSVLPYLYVAVFVAVSVPSLIYGRVAEKFRRDRLIIGLTTILLISMVLSRLFLSTIDAEGDHWFFAVFYVWVEVMGAFLMIQFFTFAADIFTSRETKRLFAFILGGGTMSNIIFGFGARMLVKDYGVETNDLIWVVVLCFAICLVCVFALGRSESEALDRAFTGRRSKQKGAAARKRAAADEGTTKVKQKVLATKHVRFIALIVMITFLTTQFIDFTFKALATQKYSGESGELGSFFGTFYGYLGIISILFQFFFTRRILEQFGVLVALLVLPVSLFLGSGALGVAGAMGASIATLFMVGTIAQGASQGLRYTVYDATMQLLYTPIPSDVRARAKSFIDGILKPGAIGAAGLLLLLLSKVFNPSNPEISYIGFGTLVFAVVWIVLLVGVRKEYIKSLINTLAKKRLDFQADTPDLDNPETIETLVLELSSGDPRRIRNGLELAQRVQSSGLDHALGGVLGRSEADIRQMALHALGRRGAWKELSEVHACIKDPEPEVRAAAVEAFCAIAREKAIEVSASLLDDESPLVRESAIAGLIQHGGLDGILRAAEPLKQLLESEEPDDRVSAARVLHAIRVRNFYQPVLRLLADESPKVVKAALEAAGAMKTEELVPSVIYCMDRRGYANHAARALISMGDEVVPLLSKVIGNPRESANVRAMVPRVLSHIGTPLAKQVLKKNLLITKDRIQRYRIATALSRLRLSDPKLLLPKKQVLALLEDELSLAYKYVEMQAAFEAEPELEPLFRAMDDRLRYARRRILKLLALIHDPQTILAVSRNLDSQQAVVRDNAVEVLDDLVDVSIRRPLVNLLDRSDLSAKLQAVAALYPFPEMPMDDRLALMLEEHEPFLVSCAAYLLGKRQEGHVPVKQLRGLLDANAPVIRESVAQCLFRRCGEEALEWIRPLMDDPVPNVRRMARALSQPQ